MRSTAVRSGAFESFFFLFDVRLDMLMYLLGYVEVYSVRLDILMYLDAHVNMYAISFIGALLVLTHAIVKLRATLKGVFDFLLSSLTCKCCGFYGISSLYVSIEKIIP